MFVYILEPVCLHSGRLFDERKYLVIIDQVPSEGTITGSLFKIVVGWTQIDCKRKPKTAVIIN